MRNTSNSLFLDTLAGITEQSRKVSAEFLMLL
jgi:hypothetical protein